MKFAGADILAVEENGEMIFKYWAIYSDRLQTGTSPATFIKAAEHIGGYLYFYDLKKGFSYLQKYTIERNIYLRILESSSTLYSVKGVGYEMRSLKNYTTKTKAEIIDEYATTARKGAQSRERYSLEDLRKQTENAARAVRNAAKHHIETIKEVLKSAGAKTSARYLFARLTNSSIAFRAFRELSEYDNICRRVSLGEYKHFREAYRGGYVFARPGTYHNIRSIDKNKMYTSYYRDYPLPYGNPIACDSFEALEKYKFYICGVYMRFELKEGALPYITIREARHGVVNLEESSGGEYVRLTLSNIDIDIIKRLYDVDIIFQWGFGFYTSAGIFRKYADTFLQMLDNAKDKKEKEVIKLLLNMPTGRLGMNAETEHIKYREENGIIKPFIDSIEEQEERFNYFPMGIALTAYGRREILETGEKVGFDKIVYIDTDCIKYKGAELPPGVEIDRHKLGAYKDEGTADIIKILTPKRYCTYQDETLSFKYSGYPHADLKKAVRDGEKMSRAEAERIIERLGEGDKIPITIETRIKGGYTKRTIYKGL